LRGWKGGGRRRGRWRRARRRRVVRRPAALPEIGIPCLASGDDLRVDLRQRLVGASGLRGALHDRPDAIDLDAIASPRAALYKAGVPAGRDDLQTWPRSLHRMSCDCASQSHCNLANNGNSHSGLEHRHHPGLDIGCTVRGSRAGPRHNGPRAPHHGGRQPSCLCYASQLDGSPG
jgi:hypothetical protein